MDAQHGIARRTVLGLPKDGLTPAWERDFAAFPPAGVILFRRDFPDLEGLRALTRRLRGLAKPRRLFIGVDEEGGFVSQLGGHLDVPPSALLLARGARPGDIEWVSRVTGERLRSVGIDWVYAPVADIHSEPANPVIGPRSYGTTPDAVVTALAEVLRGFRAAGVASCLKHFPGHGDTRVDSHLALPRCDASLETLERRELIPFRAHVGAADTVMTAHLVVPALDPGERPATFSRTIVENVLRGSLGFQGVVVTDALEMKGAAEGRGPAETGRLALEAGCDLLLYATFGEDVRRARYELARALSDGAFDRATFDAARPRLMALDQRIPEPSDEELGRSLEALTPPDWAERLEAIIERGLETRGRLPEDLRGGCTVSEPAPAYGPTLRELLESAGVTTSSEPAGLHVEVIVSRVPLPAAERERLDRLCRERPTAVVALQADEFLDALDRAVLRISACDPTPLTRRVIARQLAARLQGAVA